MKRAPNVSVVSGQWAKDSFDYQKLMAATPYKLRLSDPMEIEHPKDELC